ncbi:MAG: ABC transporter permease [Clostridia bacterium]|nr:ABC transporter permease [Clostridia bacterium]
MRQFFTVFKFELLGQLQSKIFKVITILLVIGILLSLNFTRLENALGTSIDDLGGEKEPKKIAVQNHSDIDTDALIAALSEAFGDDYEIIEETSKNMKQVVKKGYVESAIIIESETKYQYIVETAGMYDYAQEIVNSILQTNYRYTYLANKGLSPDEVNEALNTQIDGDIVITGKDQTQSFLYTYAVIMVLYMVLLLYGQFVASSVAGEKSTRCMEVLITSAKPMNLMFGKVLGSGSAGLLQIVIIFATAIGSYQFNKDIIENDILTAIFGMPVSVAVYSVVFFILGYFIYAFMFGAAGSLASRAEDLGALTLPINLIFIIAFMVAVFGMTSGNIDNTFFVVCSFLPTFAPMIMLVRICMGTVAVWEIALSIGIQVATIVLLGIACAKIYRAGVLLYGNPPKFKDIWKILTTKQE